MFDGGKQELNKRKAWRPWCTLTSSSGLRSESCCFSWSFVWLQNSVASFSTMDHCGQCRQDHNAGQHKNAVSLEKRALQDYLRRTSGGKISRQFSK